MPHYLIEYADNGDAAARERLRASHIAYRVAAGDRLLLAGPLLDENEVATGSIILLEADNEDRASTWAAADPLVEAGVLSVTSLRRMRVASLMGRKAQLP